MEGSGFDWLSWASEMATRKWRVCDGDRGWDRGRAEEVVDRSWAPARRGTACGRRFAFARWDGEFATMAVGGAIAVEELMALLT